MRKKMEQLSLPCFDPTCNLDGFEITASLLSSAQGVAGGGFTGSHVEEDGVSFGCIAAMGDEDDGGIGLISSSPCFCLDRIVRPHDCWRARGRQMEHHISVLGRCTEDGVPTVPSVRPFLVSPFAILDRPIGRDEWSPLDRACQITYSVMPASRSIIFPKSFMVANQEYITGNDSKRWQAAMRSQQLHLLLRPIVDDNGGVRSPTTLNLATKQQDSGSEIRQPNPKIHQIQPTPTPSPISHNLTHPSRPISGVVFSVRGRQWSNQDGRLNDMAVAIRPAAAAAFSSITAGENPSPLPLTAGEPSRRHASAQPHTRHLWWKTHQHKTS
ncbi:hypothetical protein ACLOJK_000261 [Asimina triloba]